MTKIMTPKGEYPEPSVDIIGAAIWADMWFSRFYVKIDGVYCEGSENLKDFDLSKAEIITIYYEKGDGPGPGKEEEFDE